MNEKYSTSHLITCLTEKQKYKGTAIYLHQVTQFNEAVYTICNDALVSVLINQQKNYFAKLMALRFFKELFVTGNITLIDELDENIEKEIVAVAQFNKKSKEINRGANYFIDKLNLKKDADIQKIGASYVILATQIIGVFAKWYPIDQVNQNTRFKDYYDDLSAVGISFPKDKPYNFFKKDQEEKFKKNYQTWLKWYVQNVKEEQNQETAKQIESRSVGEPALDKKEEEAKISKKEKKESMKDEEKIKKQSVIKEESKPIKQDIKKEQLPSEMPQGQTKPNSLVVSESSKLKEPKIEKKQFSVQVEIQHPKSKADEVALEKALKDKQEMSSKHSTEVHQLKKKIQQLQNISQGRMQTIEKQNESSQSELQLKTKAVETYKRQNQNLKDQIAKLTAQLALYSKQPEPKPTVQTVVECYNIKVSPPKDYDNLEQQIQILTSALEQSSQMFESKKKAFQAQIYMLQEQSKQLKEQISNKDKQLQDKIKQLQSVKSSKDVHTELIHNIIRQDSLIIEDQPRIQFKNNTFLNQVSEPQSIEKENGRGASITQHRLDGPRRQKEGYNDLLQARTRSLRKTQSQHRLNKNYNTFSNTGFGMPLKTTSKLNKTTNNFTKKQSEYNNYVTFYPFLDNYFPVVPLESVHFKQECLQTKVQRETCFENDLIRASISKNSSNCFTLTLLNLTNNQLKIKLLSGHYSFAVKGEKSSKIQSMCQKQFQIVAQNIDLNLRYPVISVMVGTQRISLTNSVSQDRNMHIPLPVTLLDFCNIYPQKGTEWLSDLKFTKYSSNKIPLNKCLLSIEKCLSPFKITYHDNEIIASAGISLAGSHDSKIYVEIVLNHSDLWVNIQFGSRSTSSCSLTKVVMQTLLFLLQK